MKLHKYIGKRRLAWMAMLPLALTVSAQTAERKLCDFETAGSYSAIGVYDTWENSPFRTGAMTGNVRVVANHLAAPDPVRGFAPNPSGHVLALQRSRYGSNTFGALVSLKEPFAQTKHTQYVHVKIYSPKASPVMLIGLGNRDDRPHQSPLTEQFWSKSAQRLVAGQWTDAVFAVSGSNGITIRSLLIVPDATSPHNLDDDFAVYIDDITLSGDDKPFFATSGRSAAKTYRHGDRISLSRGVDELGGGLNGDILLADGTAVTGKTAAYGEPLKVKAVPAPGFRFSKLVIRHGANLDGERQQDWNETTVSAAEFRDGIYTVPAAVVDGDVRFIPYFSSEAK